GFRHRARSYCEDSTSLRDHPDPGNLHHRPERHSAAEVCECVRLEHAGGDGLPQPLVRTLARPSFVQWPTNIPIHSRWNPGRLGTVELDTQGERKMNPAVIEGFTVVGIEARTDNAREMTGTGIIAKQWGRFVGENLLAQIPNRIDSAILAVYSDYESDEDGEYSFMIGARVTSAAAVPAGMVARSVPGGRYAVFTSERGAVEKVVVETWQKIWSATKAELGGERAYSVDFEVDDERARDPKNTQVDIYVGIK